MISSSGKAIRWPLIPSWLTRATSGLVQHFFTLAEIKALFDGQFRIIYSEINERRMEPDFERRYSRWVLATEAI